jgi:hypothetical protein
METAAPSNGSPWRRARPMQASTSTESRFAAVLTHRGEELRSPIDEHNRRCLIALRILYTDDQSEMKPCAKALLE